MDAHTGDPSSEKGGLANDPIMDKLADILGRMTDERRDAFEDWLENIEESEDDGDEQD